MQGGLTYGIDYEETSKQLYLVKVRKTRWTTLFIIIMQKKATKSVERRTYSLPTIISTPSDHTPSYMFSKFSRIN